MTDEYEEVYERLVREERHVPSRGERFEVLSASG